MSLFVISEYYYLIDFMTKCCVCCEKNINEHSENKIYLPSSNTNIYIYKFDEQHAES